MPPTTTKLATAMILAAGHGRRMLHLTKSTPKPLLEIDGQALIEFQLERLASAGITTVVVNTGRFGDRLQARLGDGARFGLAIRYSHEGNEPLQTGGGILRALALLGPAPFLLTNADVWCDLALDTLPAEPPGLAHLVLVDNPPHHDQGDFCLLDGEVHLEQGTRYTYSGIAVLRPELFADCQPGMFELAPILRLAAAQGLISGHHHAGAWMDIGTPERLAELAQRLAPD